MNKANYLISRTFKGAMAFVLAVGLCPVAPAMAQEGATVNEEGGTAAAAVDGAGASTDGAVAGATGDVAGSEADGVQPGGVSGDGDAAADGAGVDAPVQDAVENDATDSGASPDVVDAASAVDGEADESNDAAAQTDGWQAWGGCEWMIDSEGCLTIRPKDGAGVGQLPNVADYAPWCASEYNRNIEVVRVENGVKTSEYAGWLFAELSFVETMDLSGLDISSATSMQSMFYGCSKLASLDVSGWDTSSATNMDSMFYGCSKLASLDVSGWDTSSVTNMFWMFFGCSSLASLDVSRWDVSSATSMGRIFCGCSKLASLDVSGWDTSRVTNMLCMFFGCSSLASLDVSGWDTSRVTNMDGMFYGCSSLASVGDLSGWDTSGVTKIGDMFYGCSSLASLDVSGWDTSRVADMSRMLSGCSSLASLDVSGWDTSGVTRMQSMFFGCSKLASLDVSGWDTSRVADMSRMLSGCSSLAHLDLSGWNTSKVTSMDSMFFGCSSLASVGDLSGWDTSSVASMGSMFQGCSSLAALDASGWDTSRVADMSRMFSGCSSLTSLDASNCDTSCVTDMASMFSGCSRLASLDLSSWDASNVGGMEGMFYACLRLEQIAVGNGFDLCRVTVDPSLVEGWTGKWVNQAGDAFPMAAIPSGTKDVYRAQIALCNDMFEVDCSDSPYTGSEITKEIRSSKLQEGVDYEVSYSDNVSAGTASISICGIGRAVGTLHYEFNITKKSPTFDAPAPLDATYGQKLADLMLPEGFSWQDAGDADVGDPGEHEYLAMYTPSDGTEYETVRDVPVKVRVFCDVDASMFSVDAAGLAYDGSAHEPAVSSAVVPEGSYSVGYRDNVSAGEATAVVSGEGFYRGSCELKFAIAKATPDYEAPAPVEAAYGQRLSGVALPKGFSWQDDPSTSVGDAGEHEFLAAFTPGDAANYETVRDVPVKVRVFRAVDASMFSVDAAGLAYDGSAHEPAVSSAVVPEGSYSVGYRDNVSAGEAAAVVSGSGFYRGSCELKFAIAKATPDYDSPAPVEAAYGQRLSDVALPKGFSWQDGDIVVDWYGKKTLFVRFTPNDQANYNSIDGIPVDVVARHKDLKTAEIKFEGSQFEYTGHLVKPSPSIAMDGESLVEGVDYSVEYRNNVLPGKAEALVCGMGRFAGSSVGVSFDIVRSAGNYIALPGHWATGSGGWWYPYDNGGYPANEWCIIDDAYYHFNGSGYMQTGWLSTGGAWYYLSGSGAMATGWLSLGGTWYWFDASGAMASGWKQIDGSYYYFDGSGAMQTGWLSTGGAWYYLSDSGAMATGWKWIDGSCYYFDGSGAMQANKWIDGSYVDSDGRWVQNA